MNRLALGMLTCSVAATGWASVVGATRPQSPAPVLRNLMGSSVRMMELRGLREWSGALGAPFNEPIWLS
jgi:hypothetical protein